MTITRTRGGSTTGGATVTKCIPVHVFEHDTLRHVRVYYCM